MIVKLIIQPPGISTLVGLKERLPHSPIITTLILLHKLCS